MTIPQGNLDKSHTHKPQIVYITPNASAPNHIPATGGSDVPIYHPHILFNGYRPSIPEKEGTIQSNLHKKDLATNEKQPRPPLDDSGAIGPATSRLSSSNCLRDLENNPHLDLGKHHAHKKNVSVPTAIPSTPAIENPTHHPHLTFNGSRLPTPRVNGDLRNGGYETIAHSDKAEKGQIRLKEQTARVIDTSLDESTTLTDGRGPYLQQSRQPSLTELDSLAFSYPNNSIRHNSHTLSNITPTFTYLVPDQPKKQLASVEATTTTTSFEELLSESQENPIRFHMRKLPIPVDTDTSAIAETHLRPSSLSSSSYSVTQPHPIPHIPAKIYHHPHSSVTLSPSTVSNVVTPAATQHSHIAENAIHHTTPHVSHSDSHGILFIDQSQPSKSLHTDKFPLRLNPEHPHRYDSEQLMVTDSISASAPRRHTTVDESGNTEHDKGSRIGSVNIQRINPGSSSVRNPHPNVPLPLLPTPDRKPISEEHRNDSRQIPHRTQNSDLRQPKERPVISLHPPPYSAQHLAQPNSFPHSQPNHMVQGDSVTHRPLHVPQTQEMSISDALKNIPAPVLDAPLLGPTPDRNSTHDILKEGKIRNILVLRYTTHITLKNIEFEFRRTK